MGVVEFRVLGPVEAWHDGRPVPVGAPMQRAVLAALLLRPEAVPVEMLVDQLWGVRPPPTARVTVRNYVSRLRRRLPAVVLETEPPGYRLRVPADAVDLWRFEDRRRRARELSADDPDTAAAELAAALGMWRGHPLSNLGGVPLCQVEAPRLLELRAGAVEDWARLQLRLDRPAAPLAELARLVDEDPLREPAHALLMLALYRSGRRAAALAAYDTVRARLAEELGLDPGPELRQLRQQILEGAGRRAPGGDQRPDPARPSRRPPVAAPGQLPAGVSAFTGRVRQLRQLDRLAADGQTATVLVSGTAGVGKTALAVTWAQRVRSAYPDGQLFCDLRGYGPGRPVRPVQALARFLRALGVPPADVPVEVDEAAALYRTLLAGRRLLVLLDNAGGPRQVRPLLPGTAACLVVVTSRDTLGGLVAREGAQPVSLGVLSAAESAELLGRLLGPAAVTAEPAAAAELAGLCAHLPLALRVAAANLAGRPGGITGYVKALRTGDRLAALAVPGDNQAAVEAAFDVSYAALPPGARRLLRLLGLVPGPDVTAEAAAALAGESVADTVRTIGHLLAAHLVDEPEPGRYGLHDLLREYARRQAGTVDGETEGRAAVARLLEHYLHRSDTAARLLYPQMVRLPVPPPSRPVAGFPDADGALGWLDAERANLIAAVAAAAEHGPARPAWLLADALRGYFWLRRSHVDWLGTAQRARAMAVEHREPQAQAAAELSLGLAHYSQGRLAQAVEHYAAALRLARRCGWRAGQATSLGNLGNVQADLGRLSVSAQYQTEALRLNRAAGRAANLNSLGAVHREWGKLAEAADHYAQALAAHRASGSRTGVAVALTNLGEVYHELGRLPEALDSLTTAVRLCRQAGLRDGEADALDNLAGVERDIGRYGPAAGHAQAALELAREIGDRRTEAEALATLASIGLRTGRPDEALDRYRGAREVARRLGNRSGELVGVIGLAAAHRLLGRLPQALNAARLGVDLAAAGEFRALEALARTELAAVLLAAGRDEPAAQHAEQALTLVRATGHRLGEARVHRVLGLARRGTDPGAAERHRQAAAELCAELGIPDGDRLGPDPNEWVGAGGPVR